VEGRRGGARGEGREVEGREERGKEEKEGLEGELCSCKFSLKNPVVVFLAVLMSYHFVAHFDRPMDHIISSLETPC